MTRCATAPIAATCFVTCCCGARWCVAGRRRRAVDSAGAHGGVRAVVRAEQGRRRRGTGGARVPHRGRARCTKACCARAQSVSTMRTKTNRRDALPVALASNWTLLRELLTRARPLRLRCVVATRAARCCFAAARRLSVQRHGHRRRRWCAAACRPQARDYLRVATCKQVIMDSSARWRWRGMRAYREPRSTTSIRAER